MPPSILVVGATGNTGRGVVKTLSKNIASSDFSHYRVIALTRNAEGSAAKEIPKLPNVELVEKDWTFINDDWLREYQVERLFIASHNLATHFTDESLFLNYALQAGVKYAVRISTTRANIGPATKVFYGRNHWAIEAMLETPEFDAMHWTSLQPNVFISQITPSLVEWVKAYKKDGKKQTYKTMFSENDLVAPIDSEEVGFVAAALLSQGDTSPHNKKKYVLVGPTNTSGKEVVETIEKYAGTTVDDVHYKDLSWLEWAKSAYPENVLPSLGLAPRGGDNDATSVEKSPTSHEVLKLYQIKNTPQDAWREALSNL